MRILQNNIHIRQTKKNLIRLSIRIFQAITAAITAVIIVHSFSILINNLQRITQSHFKILPIWTILGAGFVALVIYKISPNSKGEGVPSYIRSVNHLNSTFSIKETIFKYWAALFTLGTFGNGGIVGPVGRVSAGVNAYFEEKLNIKETMDLKVGAICGFAAAISLIFHAPIAGGIFAVEILERSNMRYRYLFPTMLSSAFAVFFAKNLGFTSFYNFSIPDVELPNTLYMHVIIVGIITGFAGRYYNILYKKIATFINRNHKQNLFKEIIIGSALVSIITFLINPELMGTSKNIINYIVSDIDKIYGNLPGTMNIVFVLFILIVTKTLANCITVGTGLNAGFAGPIIIVGMLIGVIISTVFGIEYYSSEYYAMICAGFTGMLASSMNIPIAAMILSLEVFGYNYAITGIVSTIIAFKINDYSTIYDYGTKSV